jgi:hypothetical protein
VNGMMSTVTENVSRAIRRQQENVNGIFTSLSIAWCGLHSSEVSFSLIYFQITGVVQYVDHLNAAERDTECCASRGAVLERCGSREP